MCIYSWQRSPCAKILIRRIGCSNALQQHYPFLGEAHENRFKVWFSPQNQNNKVGKIFIIKKMKLVFKTICLEAEQIFQVNKLFLHTPTTWISFIWNVWQHSILQKLTIAWANSIWVYAVRERNIGWTYTFPSQKNWHYGIVYILV